MNRINLLPPEILEKRKSERRLIYVAIAAAMVAVVLVGVYGFALMRVSARENEVAARQQELAQTQARAAELKVFEDKSLELSRRKAIADTALAGRMNWARLFDEVSLVMPTDLWASSMSAAEDSGLLIDGFAVDSDTDSPDLGHKSIAKLLVRLANLDQLIDVWLTNAVKTKISESDVIQFSISAGVSEPTTASADAGNQ